MASAASVSGILGQAHFVDGDPTVDPARRVPLVEQVRQRHEDEAVRVEGVKGDALRLRAEFADLALGDPASQESGQAGRLQAAHRGAQGAGGERPVPAWIEHAIQDVFARLRDLQGLGQQITVVVDHYVMRAQRIGERVVLGLCPAHPEHVVEEQVGGVLGRQPLKFEVRTVQYHLPQAADLRIHVEHGTPGSGRILLVSYLMAGFPGERHGPRGGPLRIAPEPIFGDHRDIPDQLFREKR